MNKRIVIIFFLFLSVGSLVGEVLLSYSNTFNSLLFMKSSTLNSNSFCDGGDFSISLKEKDFFFTLGLLHDYVNIDISNFLLEELDAINIPNSKIEKKTSAYYPVISLGYKDNYLSIALSDTVSYDLKVEIPIGKFFSPGFRFSSYELFYGNISLFENYYLVNPPLVNSSSYWFNLFFYNFYLRVLTEAKSFEINHTLKEKELGLYIIADGNKYEYKIGYKNERLNIELDLSIEEFLLPDNIYGYLGNKAFLTSLEESDITYKRLYLLGEYNNYRIGLYYGDLFFSSRSLTVNSYPFIYGPLVYRIYEIDIPNGHVQVIGGDIGYEFIRKRYSLETRVSYRKVISDIEDISYLYNEYTLLQILPKLIGYSDVEYFDPWKSNIDLFTFLINYNFELSESCILGFSINQLIPFLQMKKGEYAIGGSSINAYFTLKL